MAPTSSTRGSAAVYVDGVSRGTVSFRLVDRPQPGRHLLGDLRERSARTRSSVRARGNGRVDIDAFVVFR